MEYYFAETSAEQQRLIRFSDDGKVKRCSPIQLEGIPFIVVGYKVMECHQGPVHKRNSIEKQVPVNIMPI